MRLLLLVAATALLAGCGSHEVALTHRTVTPAEWRAVFEDWYDGKLSNRHSCAAVITALSHAPIDGTYSTVVPDLERYAARVCTSHPNLAALRVGMTDEDVALLAGAPRLPAFGSCWTYGGTHVCFDGGRVASVGRLCTLSALRGSVALQGATGSELGGLTVSNPGPACSFDERPTVELDWHGRSLTPPQRAFTRGALRSLGFTRVSRLLPHGGSRLVWLQWLDYCGPKLPAGATPVAVLRVSGEAGALRVRLRGGFEPPFCNSPAGARLFATDFALLP